MKTNHRAFAARHTRRSLRLGQCLLLLCLGATGILAQEPTADRAVGALWQAGADIDKQAAALRTLNALGAAAVEPLLPGLAAEDRQVRLNTALALGRLRTPRAVEPLLARCREDADPEVRGGAAEALGRIGDPRAVAPLIGQLSGADVHELDRRGAAVALGALRATEAVPALLRRLESAAWEERWRAAVALGQIADPRARGPLGQLAGDGNAVVTACAAWASSVLIGTPDLKPLGRNLRGTDDGVIWASAWALGVIGTPAAVEILRAAQADGPAAAQTACRMVLTWLDPPAAAVATGAAPAAAGGDYLALDERWSDRFGKLDIRVTRPVVISSRSARPELGVHARPRLYPLPGGDLLLVVEPDPESKATAWAALRSRDQGQTWQSESALVRRPATLAGLRNGSVLAYDQYLFQKEGQQYANDLCVSRDGGRSFGPLQLAQFALSVHHETRAQLKDVVDAYKAGSAQWSGKACLGLGTRVVELGDGTLVAGGLARLSDAAALGALCYRSADKGLTWIGGVSLARDEVSALALVEVEANRLLALLAMGADSTLHVATSSDGGATWSEPRPRRERAAAVDLCRLPSGVLACCYGGPGLVLLFSVDGGGKTWTDRIQLWEEGDGVSGSASLCQAGPDRMLIVYDRQGLFPEIDAKPTSALFGATITVVRNDSGKP